MRRIFAVFLAVPLAACDPGVMSRSPLIEMEGPQAEEGLWALLPPGCEAPASASITRWPECAAPAWLNDGIATALPNGTPSHVGFVMGSGDPRLIQLKGAFQGIVPPAPEGAEGNESLVDVNVHYYWAFKPEGPPPYRRGKLWPIGCPEPAVPGIAAVEGERGCFASNLDALRAVSRIQPKDEEVRTAVWIAPQQ
jgi:hypothetical protein